MLADGLERQNDVKYYGGKMTILIYQPIKPDQLIENLCFCASICEMLWIIIISYHDDLTAGNYPRPLKNIYKRGIGIIPWSMNPMHNIIESPSIKMHQFGLRVWKKLITQKVKCVPVKTFYYSRELNEN